MLKSTAGLISPLFTLACLTMGCTADQNDSNSANGGMMAGASSAGEKTYACPAIAATCPVGREICAEQSLTCQPVTVGTGVCAERILCTKAAPPMMPGNPEPAGGTESMCADQDLSCPPGSNHRPGAPNCDQGLEAWVNADGQFTVPVASDRVEVDRRWFTRGRYAIGWATH